MKEDTVLEQLFFTARHIGRVEPHTAFSAEAQSGKAGFGSVLILGLLADEDKKLISARFKAYGPPALIAAAEYLCRQIEGQPLALLQKMSAQDIQKALEIDTMHYPELLRLIAVYEEALNLLWSRVS